MSGGRVGLCRGLSQEGRGGAGGRGLLLLQVIDERREEKKYSQLSGRESREKESCCLRFA